MSTFPPQLFELLEKFSLPTPWRVFATYSVIVKEDEQARDDAIRRFAENDSLPPSHVPNPDQSESSIQPTIENIEVYHRLRRMGEFLDNDPRIIAVRQKQAEWECLLAELTELDKLVRDFAPDLLHHLLGYLPLSALGYCEFRESDIEKRTIAIRTILGEIISRQQSRPQSNKSNDLREYKNGGRPRGKPLTVEFITQRYNISGTKLSNHPDAESNRIKDPENSKRYLYRWVFIKALTDAKLINK